jgi:hypothetical protein
VLGTIAWNRVNASGICSNNNRYAVTWNCKPLLQQTHGIATPCLLCITSQCPAVNHLMHFIDLDTSGLTNIFESQC